MDFQIKNTNNASLGQASPTVFYAGGFKYGENTPKIDFNKKINLPKGVNNPIGTEIKIDK